MIRKAWGNSLSRRAFVSPAGLLQIVDRIQINVGPSADAGLEIAGHAQIENKKRPAEPGPLDPPKFGQFHDRLPAPVVLMIKSAVARASRS